MSFERRCKTTLEIQFPTVLYCTVMPDAKLLLTTSSAHWEYTPAATPATPAGGTDLMPACKARYVI